MGGCCGDTGCGRGDCETCAGCNGTYPDIASAFSKVYDNFNSVTNFYPLHPVYDELEVTDKAVENLQRRGRRGGYRGNRALYSGDCCEKNNPSFGFVAYPQILETVTVDVCGKARCFKKGPRKDCKKCCEGNGTCDDCRRNNAFCDGFGFTWAQTGGRKGYFRAVEACGKIRQDVGCKKNYNPNCNYSSYSTVLSCHNSCNPCGNGSSSSSNGSQQRSNGNQSRSRKHGGGCGC